MADVDLRQLKTMIAIAEEGTFSRAANRLGYTQSNVSQHIAALEKTLGGSVFDRPGGPRPVRITPLGAVVPEQGRELPSKAEALGHAVDRFKAGDGRIDVGTLQSVSNMILPTVLRRLRDEHPNCEIRISEAEPDEAQIGDLKSRVSWLSKLHQPGPNPGTSCFSVDTGTTRRSDRFSAGRRAVQSQRRSD
ncbi:LysR family transcriptional regulator [Nonomuraea sp. NPDC049480]|uniref:LysR family transcriptional regulator n=1 Tax=Nonomuraea sp. NPDC049480 TaxID=3364353 RepID=UPI0037A32252